MCAVVSASPVPKAIMRDRRVLSEDIPARGFAARVRLRQDAVAASGKHRMEQRTSVCRGDQRLAIAATVVLALVGCDLHSPAQAQGRLDARYTASLAGVPVGRGAWFVEIGDGKYLAAASGATMGLMRLFSSGEGTGAARGSIVNGELVPSTYAASITADHKTSEVRMALAGGDVKTFAVSPVVPPDAERVPLKEAHRHGVIDPMTGSIYRVSGGDPLTPASCRRNIPVFDGRMRYDLHLAFKRMDRVKGAKGYQGPVLVCAVYFDPIAGHNPGRVAIKYLTGLRSMEAWLAPISGTSVLVPYRFEIPTPIGLGVLQATQFVTVAQGSHPTPTSAQAQ
jgi:hypothetical protein